jgi:hypothetical protein
MKILMEISKSKKIVNRKINNNRMGMMTVKIYKYHKNTKSI